MAEINDSIKVLMDGVAVVQKEMNAFNGYTEIVKNVSENIDESTQKILENVEEIQKFAQNIQSISSKTNMLSLNASIEASRSGEAGRGFAVVAEQMRSLANDTKDSSAKILSVIEEFAADIAKMKKELQKQAESQSEQAESTQKILKEMSGIEVAANEIKNGME